MNVRFYIDPSGFPHFEAHGVTGDEVRDVLRRPLEEIRGRRGTMVAHGRTRGGRYLKVVYAPDAEEDGIVVITAYDLPPRQVRALLARLRRKGNRP